MMPVNIASFMSAVVEIN